MQLGEIKIAKNSRKFSNFHETYYEKKSPILFRYTVRPPICGFFPFQKFVHKSGFVKKSGFVHKSGESPQIESVGDFIYTICSSTGSIFENKS